MDATTSTEAMEIQIHERLHHLNLTCSIKERSKNAMGNGGFSEVFQGLCDIEGRGEMKVSIKRIRFHVKAAGMKKAFHKELYIWSKLKHPHILQLLGYLTCEDTGYPLIISEWMDRGTAWSYIQENPQMPLSDLIVIVRDISAGLLYLHNEGVVHADMKADNVLISSNGQVKICDLGCANTESFTWSIAKMTQSKALVGTTQHWAPELFDGVQSKESDVWAFGMTVYELYARQRPFKGMSERQLIRNLTSEKPDLPTFPQWKNVIDTPGTARVPRHIEWLRPDMISLSAELDAFIGMMDMVRSRSDPLAIPSKRERGNQDAFRHYSLNCLIAPAPALIHDIIQTPHPTPTSHPSTATQ